MCLENRETNEIEDETDEDGNIELNIYGEKEDGYASEFSITISELEVIEYEDDLKSEDEEDDSDYFLFKVVMKDGTALYFHSMYAD